MQKKTNKDKIPNIEKEGWTAEKIAEESTNLDEDDIVEQMDGIEVIQQAVED